MACVVPVKGTDLSADDILAWLEGRVVKWWMPDRVEFITEVPKTSVGKFSKKALRERFADVSVD
jgi:fatty-acyl-CoA synthase